MAAEAVCTANKSTTPNPRFRMKPPVFVEYNSLFGKYLGRRAALGERMSLSKFAAAALCAVSIVVPALAARAVDPNSLDEVIKRVQEAQKKTNTLQADFKQEKTLALLSKPEVSTGRFTYQKPNSVLWTYDSPKRVTMLITNGIMTTYYPELNKAERIEVKRYQDRIFK